MGDGRGRGGDGRERRGERRGVERILCSDKFSLKNALAHSCESRQRTDTVIVRFKVENVVKIKLI